MSLRWMDRLPPWRRLALLVLPLAFLGAGIFLHDVMVANDRAREDRVVQERADGAALALQRRVESYGDVLYGIRGLFRASDVVTYREFQSAIQAQQLEERYPGMATLGILQLVTPRHAQALYDRVTRESRASHLGYGRFRFDPRTLTKQGAIVTMTSRPAHNQAAFGFDAMSEKVRAEAITDALGGSTPTATAPIRLVADQQAANMGLTNEAPFQSFSVLLPIRDRTRTADGLAFASFRVPDLVRNAIGAEERDADLAVYDAGRERTLTYSTRSTPARDAHVVHFKMMGRPWELAYAPIHRFTEDDGLLAYLPIAGGALLALLAMGLLRMTERTERRAVALAERMTEELRDSREELARSNAELERFAYVASHDLREPLRTVNGFVGLLSRRYRDRLDEDGKEFIDHAVQGVHRMDGLIAELLQYSRAGRREAGAEPTDLNAAWSVAVRNLSAAISEAGAHVTASPLPTVLAERGEMVQLFQNLLGNAIKYRAHDGPRIHVTAVPREDGTWEVSVIDDGPGIAPKDHERIFVLLERLHTYDDIEGSGIGLSLCRRIVERHGGSIWVESDLGAGARFAFALPGAPAADGDDPPEAVSPVVRDAALRAPSEPLTAAVAHAERARREHARRVRES